MLRRRNSLAVKSLSCAAAASGLVQHVHTAGSERTQRAVVVHAVERREHVETTEGCVTGTQGLERVLGSHRLPRSASFAGAREASFVGVDLHAISARRIASAWPYAG